MRGYYSSRPSGQTKSIMSRMTAGLNEYNPASTIGDNFLSAGLDVHPHFGDALAFTKDTTDTLLDADLTGTGRIYAAIADKVPTDAFNITFKDHILLVVGACAVADDDVVDNFIDMNVTDGTKTTTAMPTATHTYERSSIHSMCMFFTEVKRYVCYTNSKNKSLFTYDYTEFREFALPFYPRRIVSHAYRVFAIDTTNKLWWCRMGDLSTWYGLDSDDDYIVAETDMKNGTYTILRNPDVVRPLMVTVTNVSTADTYGILTVVGTDDSNAALTEVITPKAGIVYGLKAYKTVTSITASGWITGAGADQIKIGIAAVGNGIAQLDAGYCSFEQERTLVNLASLSGSLYIFSDVNIYIFRGSSFDTFSLTKIITDIGCDDEIAITNGIVYFTFSHDLYEFDGSNNPRVINRPIYSNGQIANGMYGGIDDGGSSGIFDTFKKLAADKDYLYVCQEEVTGVAAAAHLQLYYYRFDLRERSWWYHSGFQATSTHTTDYIRPFLIPEADRSGVYGLCTKRLATGAANGIYYLYDSPGSNSVELPYIITKAFSTIPSETGTLTDLVLLVQNTLAESLNTITVYYSLTESADDFVACYTATNRVFSGDIERISIPLLLSNIKRALHYRLKIIINPSASSTTVYLFGIERRHRILGRQR